VGSNAAASPVEAKTIAQLERYCTASWRNAGIRRDEWEDCTQQALLEMLELVSAGGLPLSIDDKQSAERRELNRTVWRLVQRIRRTPHADRFDERRSDRVANPPDTASLKWDDVASMAAEVLSARQLQILELSRDGWKVAEIADQLGLPADRVSDEKYKAINRLRERLDHGSPL
jgi:DNA-binding NarL/FixJ family response regulator